MKGYKHLKNKKGKGFWQLIIKKMKNNQSIILYPNGFNKSNGFYTAARTLGYSSKRKRIGSIMDDRYEVTLIK